jgi:cytoskeletal protein CcmA (bactofilin family)
MLRTTIQSSTALLLLAATSGAHGTVIYDDGGAHTIQSPITDNIAVINGSSLVVGSGGVVTGVAGPSSEWEMFQGAVRVNGGTLDIVGNGRIVAGANAHAINTTFHPEATTTGSIVRLRDRARVIGDIVDILPNGGFTEATAVDRLYVSDRAVVDGNISFSGYVRIEDQAMVLGDVFDQYNATYSLDMRGGVVGGTVHMHGSNGYNFNMSGGAILGGVNANNSWIVNLDMTGGYIGNGYRTNVSGAVNGEICGGQIDGGFFVDSFGIPPSSNLTISGGQFNAELNEWLMYFSVKDDSSWGLRPSQLSIYGGQFGYQEMGRGFFIDQNVNFDIHGRDLVFADGWLTGYLLDGSWFNSSLTFGSGWTGTFTIHNVPEPGTVALLMLGLAGMGIVRRRRV